MENIRVRTTKEMIQHALLNLLENGPLEKISIVTLCKEASINRSTFYKYYGSQYDVLEDIIQGIFRQLKQFAATSLQKPGKAIFSKDMLTYLMERKTLCKTLFDHVPFPLFGYRLMNICQCDALFGERLSGNISEEQQKALYTYYTYGCYGIMYQWIHSEAPMSVEQIYNLMCKLEENIVQIGSAGII